MPVYKLTFPLDAAGLDVEVVETQTGAVTAVESSAINGPRGELEYEVTLAEADYIGYAKTAEGARAYTSNAVLDVPGSIAAGGGVGASETAYFVATGPVDVSDGGGAAGALTFEADTRHDSLPTWASVVDGDIALTEEAGTVAWSLNGTYVFDFSGTTPQDSGGTLANNFYTTINGGSSVSAPTGATTGDGQDAQTADADRAGGVGAIVTFSAQGFPQATDVADGVSTPKVALTITRIAQAAVLPD